MHIQTTVFEKCSCICQLKHYSHAEKPYILLLFYRQNNCEQKVVAGLFEKTGFEIPIFITQISIQNYTLTLVSFRSLFFLSISPCPTCSPLQIGKYVIKIIIIKLLLYFLTFFECLYNAISSGYTGFYWNES